VAFVPDEPTTSVTPVASNEEPVEVLRDTRFVINKNVAFRDREGGNVVFLNYPILEFDGVEYDLESDNRSIEPFNITYTDTERIITIDMNIETGTDSFLFHSGNMLVVFDFTLDELDIDNATKLLEYMSHEDTPPTFESVLFNLYNNNDDVEVLTLYDNYYKLDSIPTLFIDADGSQVDTVKHIDISVGVHVDNNFLFHSDNMILFFGFDFTDMTYEEVEIAVDIFSRYPYEYLLDIVYEYNPTNPLLIKYGYFD
jgi:hypothetical protein